jgi:hypothetical protein
MATRGSGRPAGGKKTAAAGKKVQASGAKKPARRPTRATTRQAKPAELERPAAATAATADVHVVIDDVIVEAVEPQVEQSQLRARLSVRRGDEIVYAERVNLDWPGGRDKFLRKAGRALIAAGVATQIGEAVLSEIHGRLRARAAVSA